MLGGTSSSWFSVLPEPKVPEGMSGEEHGATLPGSSSSGQERAPRNPPV